MVSKRQYQAYATAMQTMAGTRQIVMLYDGVIRSLHQAREAMQAGRIEDRYNNLTRASEIVFGMQGCLDFEKGGDVAKTLYQFYASIDARIFSLHRSCDTQMCAQLIHEMKQMREVWDEIDRGSAAGGVEPESVSGEAAAEMPASAAVSGNGPNEAPGGVAISA